MVWRFGPNTPLNSQCLLDFIISRFPANSHWAEKKKKREVVRWEMKTKKKKLDARVAANGASAPDAPSTQLTQDLKGTYKPACGIKGWNREIKVWRERTRGDLHYVTSQQQKISVSVKSLQMGSLQIRGGWGVGGSHHDSLSNLIESDVLSMEYLIHETDFNVL